MKSPWRNSLLALVAALSIAAGEEPKEPEEIFEFDTATDADLFGMREFDTFVGAYRIRFGKDDGFRFFIPMEYQREKEPDFLAQGSTLFHGHPTDDPSLRVPVLISNRLVSAHHALVAARDYFENAADEAGVRLKYLRGDAPFDVYLTGSDNPNLFGTSRAALKNIWLKSFWDDPLTHLTSTAVHEFFHHIQSAVFNNTGIDGRYYDLTTTDRQMDNFVAEATADWAKDEPLVYAAADGTPVTQDARNDYLRRSQNGFLKAQGPILTREPYGASVLFKYFTEQLKEGKDAAAAPEMLQFLDRLTQKGTIDASTVFPTIGEMLPETWGATPDERWQRFFTRFFSAVITWQAQEGHDPPTELGFHDDAFSSIEKAQTDESTPFYHDISRPPSQVYAQPASSEKERGERLAPLALVLEVDALSSGIAHINPLRGALSAPRPLFVLARSESGHPWLDVLKQTGGAYVQTQRKGETFALVRPLSGPLGESPTVGVVADLRDTARPPYDSLWLNFCNPDLKGEMARVALAYLFSPRLLTGSDAELGGWGSDTVQIVRGAAWLNGKTGKPLQPGDTFVLSFRVPSALHGLKADLNYLEEKDCSFRLRAFGENGEELPLKPRSWEENFRIRASNRIDEFSSHLVWTYQVAGQFADTTTYAGKAHFELNLTSPLNLGEGDRQIDRSLRFDFRRKSPEIKKVTARKGGAVIYDSEKSVRTVAVSQGGSARIALEIEFTQPMKAVQVTAGEDGQLSAVGTVDGPRWQGTLEVPAIPSEGLRLTLAVRGEDRDGNFLDANAELPEAQPDISHWLMLGLEHWAEVTFTGESNQQARNDSGTVRGSLGPTRISVRLVPMRQAANRPVSAPPDASAAAQKSLESLKKGLAAFAAGRERVLQNPDQYLRGMIAFRKSTVEQARAALSQASPENRAELEKHLQQAEKNLAEIDNSLPAEKRAARAFDGQLEEMRRRIAAMQTFPEAIALITRLMAARQRLVLPMDSNGRVKDSAVIEAQSGEITITAESSTGNLRAAAPPSSSVEHGVLHLGMDVQSISREDLAALHRLVEAPEGAPGRSQAAALLRSLWEFFPPSERPSLAEQERTVPPIKGDRLIFLQANQPFSAITQHLTGQDDRSTPGQALDQTSGFMWSANLRTPPNLVDLNANLGNYTHAWGYVHDHGKAAVKLDTPGHRVEMSDAFRLYATGPGGTIEGRATGSVTLASSVYPQCTYAWNLEWKIATFPSSPAGQPPGKVEPPAVAGAPSEPAASRPPVSASAIDPGTGRNTSSTAQTDGSREIVVTDAQGREISRRREPARPPASASAYDPSTGVTISSTAQSDGSRLIQATSAEGSVLWQRTVAKK